MKHSLRGALLSGLVFPGLGQITLKCYRRGVVLLVVVSASLLLIVIKGVQQAFAILEKIELQGGALDMGTISNAAIEASTTPESLILKLLFLWVIVCWIISVVDAFRIGRRKDMEDALTSRESEPLSL